MPHYGALVYTHLFIFITPTIQIKIEDSFLEEPSQICSKEQSQFKCSVEIFFSFTYITGFLFYSDIYFWNSLSSTLVFILDSGTVRIMWTKKCISY